MAILRTASWTFSASGRGFLAGIMMRAQETLFPMVANSAESTVFQVVDRGLDAGMLIAGRAEPAGALAFRRLGVRAALDRQRTLVEQRRQLALVAGRMKPLVKTAGSQVRKPFLSLGHHIGCIIDIVALPLSIQRVCGSKIEKTFSSCGIDSPCSRRRRIKSS